MPHYDKATEEFIKKMSGPLSEEKKTDESSELRKPFRVMKTISRIIENPERNLSRLAIRNIARNVMEKDSDIKVLQLYQFMNDKYGREWWDWEPETIWKMIESDHIDGDTPESIKNAIMALQLCVNSEAPYEHWHIFEKVGHAFNWNPVSFEILQPLEPDEACLTMALLGRLQRKTIFNNEVLTYVAVCAKSGGVVYLPADLAPGVQVKLDEITFEYHLRDATKKHWDGSTQPAVEDPLHDQVEIQLHRLGDIEDLLAKEL